MENELLKEMERRIRALKRTALELKDLGGRLPAVERNTLRLLASIKMLELNISEPLMITKSTGVDRPEA